MDDMVGEELLFQPVINSFQVSLGAFIHPSTHVLRGNINFLPLKLLHDSVDWLRVDILVVIYASKKRSCCDTVPQQICRSIGTNDCFFAFAGINGYMVFDYLEAGRMKLQPFINFIRKSFILSVRKRGLKLFFTQGMVFNPYRKVLQVFFSFALCFLSPFVRLGANFFEFRLAHLRMQIHNGFRFIKGNVKLFFHLCQTLFRFSSEAFAPKKTDFFCQNVDLSG